jgi:hypothetical protein
LSTTRNHPRRPSLADVVSSGSGRPSGGLIFGPPGVGKSSLAAAAPKPLFLLSRGEAGLLTLIDWALIFPTPHFPVIDDFPALLGAIDALRVESHDYRTLVLDTLNGFERLCHEHVCRRDFGGNWGRDGFSAFMVGYETALADWRELLDALDRLREERRIGILALCHSKIATYKNPEGLDYDRFTPDLNAKTWGLTHRWADFVLFLNYETFVDVGKSPKAKGKGGTRRVLHTERTAAFDAKNRHGLPARIDCGDGPAAAWANLAAAMKAGRRARPLTQDQDQPADVPQDQSPDTPSTGVASDA